MMFKQVKDILYQIQSVYDNLNKVYTSYQDQLSDSKSKEVIKYVQSKKKKFSVMIRDYQQGADKEIVESWIQFSPEFDFQKHATELEKEKVGLSELNLLIVQFETWLLDYYSFIIDKTSSTKVKELFEKILQRQKRDSKSISTAVKILQDI